MDVHHLSCHLSHFKAGILDLFPCMYTPYLKRLLDTFPTRFYATEISALLPYEEDSYESGVCIPSL